MFYFRLKMHQNVLGGWALPGPAGGAYSTPPDFLAGFKGRGRSPPGRELDMGKGNKGEREGKEGRGKGGREGSLPYFWKIMSATLVIIKDFFMFTASNNQ